PHGLSLRHFPQSFEFSTLGGWLATRAGGHYATGYTRIDDMVESLRVITPSGTGQSRRLPSSGAGPSPDRLFLGSEGTLGIITEAWMRLQDRPRWRGSTSVHFTDYDTAVAATRAIAQSGLSPTNCRLLDAAEAFLNAGTAVSGGVLVLGFESADHPVQAWMERAVELCRDNGGELPAPPRYTDAPTPREGRTTADNWRSAFLRMPYQRDALAARSMIVETFETACTWDRFPALHAAVVEAANAALASTGASGVLTCRFTHLYPDGPAPYFGVYAAAVAAPDAALPAAAASGVPTCRSPRLYPAGPAPCFGVYAAGRPGATLQQWDEIKAAVSEALHAHGGTITHHHAVGRDHRPWYDRQRPDPFAAALLATKTALDPNGILNPGVLLPV